MNQSASYPFSQKNRMMSLSRMVTSLADEHLNTDVQSQGEILLAKNEHGVSIGPKNTRV